VRAGLKAAIAAGVAALSIVAARAATAAVAFTTTYSGHFFNGEDDLGLFGAPGGSLAGLAFSAVFYVDPNVAEPFGVTATFQAGNRTFAIQGVGDASSAANPVQIMNFAGATAPIGPPTSTTLDLEAHSIFNDFLLGVPAGQAFIDYALIPNQDIGGGTFLRSVLDPQSQLFVNTGGLLFVDHLTVTPVPEPAAWSLMILGFGATGAMLRRRQRWRVLLQTT
jgi:hypothetical protein